MDDIDFSLPVGELAKYLWSNAEGRCARQDTGGVRDGVWFSTLVSLRRNRTGAAVPAM
jgi:hypothetical protein